MSGEWMAGKGIPVFFWSTCLWLSLSLSLSLSLTCIHLFILLPISLQLPWTFTVDNKCSSFFTFGVLAFAKMKIAMCYWRFPFLGFYLSHCYFFLCLLVFLYSGLFEIGLFHANWIVERRKKDRNWVFVFIFVIIVGLLFVWVSIWVPFLQTWCSWLIYSSLFWWNLKYFLMEGIT